MTEEVRQALGVCPPEVRAAVTEAVRCLTPEELRYRCGTVLRIYAGGRETEIPRVPVTPELLQSILSAATEH